MLSATSRFWTGVPGDARGTRSARSPPPRSAAVKCSVCRSVSDTYDPYLDVALEIRVRAAAASAWGGGRGREPQSPGTREAALPD